jgi:hypothetical protein
VAGDRLARRDDVFFAGFLLAMIAPNLLMGEIGQFFDFA